MSGSTPLIDQIDFGSSQKEILVNRDVNALAPGAVFGIKTLVGLSLVMYGGPWLVAGTPTILANQTITLTDAATNYVKTTAAGVASAVTSAPASWPGPLAGSVTALFQIVCAGGVATSIIEYRVASQSAGGSSSTGAPTDAAYLLGGPNSSLSAGRVLQAGTGIALTEGGGSPPTTLTVSATTAGGAPVDAPYYIAGPSSGLSHGRELTPGTNVTFSDSGGSPPTSTAINATVPKVIQVACSDQTTAITAGTAKVTFRMPYAMTVTAVRASLATAASGSPSGLTTIDINEAGVSILSTKLSIDDGEKTSTTAATAAVISDSSLADDAEMTIDFDAVGPGSPAGVVVTLIGT